MWLLIPRYFISDNSDKSNSEERRVNGMSANRHLEDKKSSQLPADRISLVSDSEDDERMAEEKELFRRFYGVAVDRQRYLKKPGMREHDSHPLRVYGDNPYPAMAIASPIQNRLAVQAAMLQTNSYLSSFDPQRLKRARQNNWMQAMSHWRTNPSTSKVQHRGISQNSPFMNAPRKVCFTVEF